MDGIYSMIFALPDALIFTKKLNRLIEQTVPCAIPHQLSVGEEGNTRLQIPFRVLFPQDKRIIGNQSHKGNIVFLRHFMIR